MKLIIYYKDRDLSQLWDVLAADVHNFLLAWRTPKYLEPVCIFPNFQEASKSL